MAYPYGLEVNPYPSSPTPSISDTKILGGKTHKSAKNAIVSCIEDLHSKLGKFPTDKDFRLITLIQDVGSGKTHLALHIRGLTELAENTICSYVDLSKVAPRNITNLYDAILGGFSDYDIEKLRDGILNVSVKYAEKNARNAKKLLNYGLKDRIRGTPISEKAKSVLRGALKLNYSYLRDTFSEDFSELEIEIIKSLIDNKLKSDVENIRSLEGVINSLSAITSINYKITKKLTIFQFDEFDSNEDSLVLMKAIINAHIPSSILMLILTPSSYNEIRTQNGSVFDRLEKANYKIDLAGSSTLNELLDIIFEYLRFNDRYNMFDSKQESDLTSQIRIIFDEFPDFRNVRSVLNIMYHATEVAARLGSVTIDEDAIDETIKSVYPGLKIKGSLMDVSLSDFIKIRKVTSDMSVTESEIREAVRNLLSCTNYTGNVKELNLDSPLGDGIDVVYSDEFGSKVAVSVVLNSNYSAANAQVSNITKSLNLVDKLLILTNSNTCANINANNSMNSGSTLVNMDRTKIIDLIYFNNKFKNQEIMNEDLLKSITLAKSIKLC